MRTLNRYLVTLIISTSLVIIILSLVPNLRSEVYFVAISLIFVFVNMTATYLTVEAQHHLMSISLAFFVIFFFLVILRIVEIVEA